LQRLVNQMFAKIRDNTTLKDKTLDLLTNAILSSKIKPGERLNESELARKLHVSRAPVREALQQLEEQGLIVNVPRRGMFVVSLEEEDLQKINSMRLVLESEALRLARKHLTAKGREKLMQITERMEKMEASSTIEATRIDMEFHRTIWSLTGNEYLRRTLTSLTAPLFAHAMLTYVREENRRRMVLDSHRPLLRFVLGESSESAEEVMLAHLSLRWTDPARFSSLTDGHSFAEAEKLEQA
jgi:DNA-binding GntR family transcriptional regulator